MTVGRSLVSHHDLESVLGSVLEAAQDLTHARYAALGILDKSKERIERFVHVGLDDDQRRRIGPLPRGRGVLGELIRSRTPMRMADVGEHPHAFGFPAGHPQMTAFVGVPVMIRGELFGIVFVTDKLSAREFNLRDEHLLMVLADWTAVAIENARLYDEAARHGSELERTVEELEATVALSRLGTMQATSLDWLLEMIAKRGRALAESRWFVVLRSAELEGNELVATHVAGEVPPDIQGTRLPNGRAALRALLGGSSVRRLSPAERIPSALGISQATILAVLDHGGNEGFVIAVDPFGRDAFSLDDEHLVGAFAAGAADAIRGYLAVERDRLRLSAQSSERERRHWARELHDETLQQLGALKLMHEGALRRDDPVLYERTVERAAVEFGDAIKSLERLITELRPAALDEFGVGAALEALVDKVDARSDPKVDLLVDLAFEGKREAKRHTSELETTIYRIVQEGLNNAIKHAEADSVSIAVIETADLVEVTVADDGKGFVVAHERDRFGLSGLRERAEIVGGELKIDSALGKGTTLRASLPVAGRGAAGS